MKSFKQSASVLLLLIAAAELAKNDEFQRLVKDLRNDPNLVNFPTAVEMDQSTERNSK